MSGNGDEGDPVMYMNNSPLEPIQDFSEPETPDQADARPSILITFQNSASYYTSYMGAAGGKGGTTGRRKSNLERMESLPQHSSPQGHPIVVMNDYPTPPPLLVAVNNSRKRSNDRYFQPFSEGPSLPQGPPGPPKPPGPPGPNLPSSRRGSLATNTLELPKKRRNSLSPAVNNNSSRNSLTSERGPSSGCRPSLPTNLLRPQAPGGDFKTASLPRGFKMRPLRNSQSMPTLGEEESEGEGQPDFETTLIVPTPSPRPSVSSTTTDSQGERRPLMSENRSLGESVDEWTPQPKPNWLALNVSGSQDDNGRVKPRSVYVAEIWPSLVCILTAVLVTLIIYIVISYLYTQPHPLTRDRIAPAMPPKYPRPPPSAEYQPSYPYGKGQYNQYPYYYQPPPPPPLPTPP